MPGVIVFHLMQLTGINTYNLGFDLQEDIRIESLLRISYANPVLRCFNYISH